MTRRTGNHWLDSVKVLPQYVLPKHALSSVMHWLTRVEFTPVKNGIIRRIVHHYQIDMNSAVQNDPLAYRSFNDFFTRQLLDEARPVATAQDAIVSPADGVVSQVGSISEQRMVQAKGRYFELDALLANDAAQVAKFVDGHWLTVYLSPRDYHRVHMPVDGTLVQTSYVPGQLFAVNQPTTRAVPGLFARNERLVCYFETATGPMALVLVGAFFVGSIETIWDQTPRLRRGRTIEITRYPQHGEQQTTLKKGQEMGRFNMGSTVIVLFGPGQMTWDRSIQPEKRVLMGQQIGRLRSS